MASPSEKLAASLEVLRKFQDEEGFAAIRSRDLGETHRKRLLKHGFIRQVIKGWYIPTRPDETKGESTSWYAAFWNFCSVYLTERFGNQWCLSPEQSLAFHTRNRTIPGQLVVRSPKARNRVTSLLHGTSLLDLRAEMPQESERVRKEGLNLFSVGSALIAVNPHFFGRHSFDAQAALGMVRDASDILHLLLEGGHSTIAGRLAGGFRHIGRDRVADDILDTMKSAGYDAREKDPFEKGAASYTIQPETSPYVNRIRLMWEEMRQTVVTLFPEAPGLPEHAGRYLKQVEDAYMADAYNSLSIEGYRVSPELIERVRSGNWNPEAYSKDREHRDAMAARGYWQAFQTVKESIAKVMRGEHPGLVADRDHGQWYRELFAPAVGAGILKPADLAGYRNGQVYIQQSMHIPPDAGAVRELMPVLFDLLYGEKDAAVRAVLGHFLFVYIHPYMDGNGRVARFLMNLMLASGGYPWTVIPVERRTDYMDALEAASVRRNIEPFAELVAELLS